MSSYRGNLGNLLQHWVLCEILHAARGRANQVGLVDAHAMAPLATKRPKTDATSELFDRVRERLPGERTAYEVAWHALMSRGSGYPNSAAFLLSVWPQLYSLLLCELDSATAAELRRWAETVKTAANCVGVEVAEGNWRDRFREGIACPGELLFVCFDPYMFDRNGPGRNSKAGNMYPEDLDLLGAAIGSGSQSVVVQLSTYSANNDNPQQAVIDTVRSRLAPSKLGMISVVRADGNMMSIVLGRNLAWADPLTELPSRFACWFSRIRADGGRHSGAT